MSKRKDDISQLIQKYLKGELDAPAMHQLEKEAQNDPFLMEALEGYERVEADHQKNIGDIRSRLHARIAKKERRIIPWRMIGIAACILLFLGAGIVWLSNKQPLIPTELAKSVAPLSAKKPVDTATFIPPKKTDLAVLTKKNPHQSFYTPAVVAEAPTAGADKLHASVKTGTGDANADIQIDGPVGNSDAKVTEAEPNVINPEKKDNTPLDEMVVMGYVAQKKVGLKDSANTIATSRLGYNAAQPTATALQGKAFGLNVFKTKAKTITGIVTDATLPIPGAIVKIKGTSIGTQTDAKGKFTLHYVPDNAVIDVAYTGYEPKEIQVHKTDSLVIAMVPSSQSLNEVVVVGYGTKNDDAEDEPARPKNGWADLYKYIKENAVSPDGKAGVVKLSFVVNTDNSLSDFKVLKSVSAQTDTAAIRLVQDGPAWLHNTSGFAEKVRLRIKFELKK